MSSPDRRNLLLPTFILFSLLLHLVLLQWMPRDFLLPPQKKPDPVRVEIRPPQPPPRFLQRELDLPPKPDQERTEPARRLGPSDTVVKKETAPKGEAPEDRRPDAPVPPAPRSAPAQTAQPKPSTRPRESTPRDLPRKETRKREQAPPAPPPAPPSTLSPAEVPDLKSLLQLPETTVARLESEWRQKYRADVEKGDAVWLDTERDILISFFQRFRNNIYGVWNYPLRARERGEEGTCLLRVTINRDGTVAGVKLMESSGSTILDDEAIAAVRKGAPFGPLPRAYESETLSIFAFFSYDLTRKVIY